MKKLSFKALVKKYYHTFTFLYLIPYFIWFSALERKITADSEYHLIHSPIDDYIPFCEYFVIPYLLWFVYILAIGTWFYFKDRRDFCRFSLFLYSGMQIFLIISTLWPNGQALRPDLTTLGRDNVFIDLVQNVIYGNDTPTNIFPSIHVYNTIGACIAVIHTKSIPKDKLWIKILLVVQGLLIIASTVFMKQHSIIDVIGAFVMAVPTYFLAFKLPMKHIRHEVDENVFIEK